MESSLLTSPIKKRRRRTQTKKLLDDSMNKEEERLLHLALAKSKVEVQRTSHPELPSALVFRPSLAEFQDPMRYIDSIRERAKHTGICKIVPPDGWQPINQLDLNDDSIPFETRLQKINSLQEGKYYDDGRKHTFRSYRAAAQEFKRQYLAEWTSTPTSQELEAEYWRIVETNPSNVTVEYANDLDTTVVGSGFERPASVEQLFDDPPGTHVRARTTTTEATAADDDDDNDLDFSDPEYYKTCGWNLNNIPQWPGSLLRHIRTPINGVNVPWLYCGMLFATFCWHTEDNYLYSINYMHHGAKKRWYGVPAADALAFERVLKKNVPLRFHEDPDLLFHLVTMLSPSTLQASNVSVFSLLQEPGEFIITFPQSYHSGYSEGFNCNEAVNFALPNWIGFSTDCSERYRRFGRLSVFSQNRLLCTFADHLEEHTVESRALLLGQLQSILDEETLMRKQMQDQGIRVVVEMEANATYIDGRTMKYDDARQCKGCKHSCYFSAVACKCHAKRVSCLRHVADMCKCRASEKMLLVWLSLFEIKQLVEKVKHYQ